MEAGRDNSQYGDRMRQSQYGAGRGGAKQSQYGDGAGRGSLSMGPGEAVSIWGRVRQSQYGAG